jgi:hypothetical protein
MSKKVRQSVSLDPELKQYAQQRYSSVSAFVREKIREDMIAHGGDEAVIESELEEVRSDLKDARRKVDKLESKEEELEERLEAIRNKRDDLADDAIHWATEVVRNNGRKLMTGKMMSATLLYGEMHDNGDLWSASIPPEITEDILDILHYQYEDRVREFHKEMNRGIKGVVETDAEDCEIIKKSLRYIDDEDRLQTLEDGSIPPLGDVFGDDDEEGLSDWQEQRIEDLVNDHLNSEG